MSILPLPEFSRPSATTRQISFAWPEAWPELSINSPSEPLAKSTISVSSPNSARERRSSPNAVRNPTSKIPSSSRSQNQYWTDQLHPTDASPTHVGLLQKGACPHGEIVKDIKMSHFVSSVSLHQHDRGTGTVPNGTNLSPGSIR